MIVYGNHKWPTVKWLTKELEDFNGPPLAWGVEHEGVFGGSHRYLGLDQLQTLDGGGVRVPVFTNDWTDLPALLKGNKVAFGRKNNHTQGRDIKFGTSEKVEGGFFDSDYWTLLLDPIEVKQEWRVHVFKTAGGYRSLATGLKVPQEGATDEVIKSRRNGWTLDFTNLSPKGLRPVARKACEVLNYDFGAVDIIEKTDGTFVVLEVNSAPALRSAHTQGVWLKAIKERR